MKKKIISLVLLAGATLITMGTNKYTTQSINALSNEIKQIEEVKNDIDNNSQEINDIYIDNISYLNEKTDFLVDYISGDFNITEDTQNILNAQSMLTICDDSIAKKVEEYEKEQARIAAEKAEKQSILNEMSTRSGMIGRLTIPDIGINVACFSVNKYNGSASQAITDRTDSAAYIAWTNTLTIIADHKNQGFSALYNAVPNQTKAYLKDGNVVKTYLCTSKGNGTNTGSDLIDHNGNYVSQSSYNGILMYTCNQDWQHVTVTYWKLISTENQ